MDTIKTCFFICIVFFQEILYKRCDVIIRIPKASLMQTGENEFIQIIPVDQCEGELNELPEAEIIQQPQNFKFLDLFWFHTPKLDTDNTNQLELVTFSINLNYGNLRINGYSQIKDAIHDNAIFLTKDLLTVKAAVYPTALFYIRNLKNTETYTPMEQLYVPYRPEDEPWQTELPTTEFVKRDDRLLLRIKHKGSNYFYVFKDKQYNLFNYALDFALTKGLTMVGVRK